MSGQMEIKCSFQVFKMIYKYPCIFLENIEALRDLWIVGDVLCEIYNGLLAIRATARINKRSPPYIFDHYNVFGFFANLTFYVRSSLARILNAVIEGINTKSKLPRYVIIIPDKDILESFKFCDFGIKTLLKGSIQWLHQKINRVFETRHEDMRNQRQGSVSSVTEPRLIWVKMIDRPTSTITFKKRNYLTLAWKFNNILEEVIAEDKYSHIMSISINPQDISATGDLTSAGRYNFWKQLLDLFRKFDKGEINLSTCKPHTHRY